MAKVFVSYSRKDIEFAKHLTVELKKCELDFWIDWEGIPPTVDWWREIEKGIEEADVFLFLISPDSAKSKVCGQEIDTAVKNAKRIIPLVVRDIQGDEAPKQLSHLNWIFFRESDGFDAAFQKLLTSIHTDYEWVQQHRWLQVRALDWQRDNKDNSSLLRGKDLQEVEFQLATNTSKEPHPSDLQRAYVFASRKATDRQKRTLTSISTAGIILLAALAVFAFVQAGKASTQAAVARAGELYALAFSQEDHDFSLSLLFTAEAQRMEQNSKTDYTILKLMNMNPQLDSFLFSYKRVFSSIAFHPQEKILTCGNDDGSIDIWDVSAPDKPTKLASLHAGSGAIHSVAFSPDGKLLAASNNASITIWDVQNPQKAIKLSALAASSNFLSDVAFSPDGRLLALGSCEKFDENHDCAQGAVFLWDVSHPKIPVRLSTLSGNSSNVSSITFSPDGTKLASSSREIILWAINNPRLPTKLSTLSDHTDYVTSAAFSQDGQKLASGSLDRTVILWDISNPVSVTNISTLSDHTDFVTSVAFNTHGFLASGGLDGTIIISDTNNQYRPPRTLSAGHDNYISNVVFSPDGNTLAAEGNKAIVFWDVRNSALETSSSENNNAARTWIQKSCQRAGRNFTQVEWDKFFPTERYRKTCDEWPLDPQSIATPIS